MSGYDEYDDEPLDFDPYDDDNNSDNEDESDNYCGNCDGTGEGMYDGTRCDVCRGSGVLKYKRR